MQIAILTFDGFNELDSFIALGLLGRVPGWRVRICGPGARLTSMNGVTVEPQAGLDWAGQADAVLIGSGIRTRDIAADPAMLERIRLDPARQIIGAQCSGSLLLARLGLLEGRPICADLTTRPWLVEAGATVLDAPFVAHGSVASAGGCMASLYLAAWTIARGAGRAAAEAAVDYVAPVGEKADWVARTMAAIGPFLNEGTAARAA